MCGSFSRKRRYLWAEFQTITDIIHFYKSDPAAALGNQAARASRLSGKSASSIFTAPSVMRAPRQNFFKMHLLFLKGAQIRNPYDIGMFVQGPFAFKDLVTTYHGSAAPLDEVGNLRLYLNPFRADVPVRRW